jgi:hypothetical protein
MPSAYPLAVFAVKGAKTCAGCVARSEEVERLRTQNDLLLAQVLTLAGKADYVVKSHDDPPEDEPPQEDPPVDPFLDAEGKLLKYAENRDLKPIEFADA